MGTVLVTGAASGLGAAFVQALAKRPGIELICVDAQYHDSRKIDNMELLEVDISSDTSVAALATRLAGRCIDLVIHCAGVRGLVPCVEQDNQDDVAACETIDVMTAETMSYAFRVNAVGTFLLLRSLLPNLRQSSQAKVVVMSSRMGSIANNQCPNKAAGSAYAYRASKAAMNTIVRSLAIDSPDVAFILCHPGRVETNLVRCVEEGAVPADESVRAMLPLIDVWTLEHSGGFFDRFGARIEW